MEKKLIALFFVVLIGGLGGGYGLGYTVYQPQNQKLMEELDNLDDKVETINSTLTNMMSSFTSLKNEMNILQVTEAAYIIFQNGSWYHARKGDAAEIKFSSKNFTQLWEDVRDSIPTSGGEIFIKAGEYVTGRMLYIARPNLRVTGEGWGTKIVPSATFFEDNIGNNNSNTLMWINGHKEDTPAGGQCDNIEISHLHFDGQYNTFDVIRFGANVSRLKLHDLWVKNSNQRGIYGTQGWEVSVYNNYILDCNTGMQINNGQNILITENYVIGGYYQTTGGAHTQIGRGNGIYWNCGFNYTITDNVVIGNKWDVTTGNLPEQNSTTDSILHGIIGFGGSELLIAGNKIREVYGSGIQVYHLSGGTHIGHAVYYPWYNKTARGFPHRSIQIVYNQILRFGHGGSCAGIWVGGDSPPLMEGVDQIMINDNYIAQTTAGTYVIGIVLANSPYATISGNHIYNVTSNGISLTGSKGSNYTIVSGNLVANIDYDGTSSDKAGGIYITNSSFVTVSSNICTDYQASPTTDYGIRIRASCDHIIVSSNIANPYETVGISEETGASNIEYIGNWNGTIWLSGDG